MAFTPEGGDHFLKLRIQRNSLRLRVSRSDLATFVATGRLEETIYFGSGEAAKLTYVLASDGDRSSIDVESGPGWFTVFLPGEAARAWSTSGDVGIAGEVGVGARGALSVLVEKDFACLDGPLEANLDTFPNPLAKHCP